MSPPSSAPDTTTDGTTASRRTQLERSEAMRQRLIDATLSCLESEGYAGTTISKIVVRAEVSRGAPVHHFPTKAALIEATAEQLVRHVYVRLGEVLLALNDSEDRLRAVVVNAWQTVFGTREHAAMMELLLASRHDEELAVMMKRLWTSGYLLIQGAAEHYFEPVDSQGTPLDMMILMQWLLRGMALDRHLVDDTRFYDHFLDLWCGLLATRIRPRQGVTTPPPRPGFWDETLARK
ncbi:MAG TPA: TetR/AcrR family transcriptional regulator [Candidatus Kapabacteria bacterium]|nr:TetR/AcrR family transcriptional regulator [Candidatus Kapabacteria bacterium]